MFPYLPQPSTLILLSLIPLLCGWFLDLLFGDPAWLPHPVVAFGKWISFWEHRLNHGTRRKLKGALFALITIALVFSLTALLNYSFFIIHSSLFILWNTVIVFFCLAGHTLRREVRDVFLALDRSLDEGRRQVARIVGRDTANLSAQEVRTAALETLAENLSDGVVAPLFWFALLGVPGMLTYKMINTLDSMIGYRTARYKDFGCWAARIDDVANYIPARLTALLMIVSGHLQTLSPLIPEQSSPTRSLSRKGESLATLDSCSESVDCKPEDAPPSRERLRVLRGIEATKGRALEVSSDQGRAGELCSGMGSGVGLLSFVRSYGRSHASPNSGYPEAALAGILDCRFGGTHDYFGEAVVKPYIGDNPRPLTTADLHTSLRVCFLAELLAVALTALVVFAIGSLIH